MVKIVFNDEDIELVRNELSKSIGEKVSIEFTKEYLNKNKVFYNQQIMGIVYDKLMKDYGF